MGGRGDGEYAGYCYQGGRKSRHGQSSKYPVTADGPCFTRVFASPCNESDFFVCPLYSRSDPGTGFAMHVIVTGGGSGIGQKVAQIFAGRGADVSVLDLVMDPEVLATIEAARRSPAQRVAVQLVDVTDAAAAAKATDAAVASLGPPEVVFHAAGIGGFSRPFELFPAERFERMVQVNLFGTRNVAAAVLPHLRRGSHFAIMASLAGLTAAYGQAGYASSKHGVMGLASVLRTEWAPRGIRVSAVCPPEIDTPMARSEARDRPPETEAMKLFAGIVDLDRGCRYMVDRVMRGHFLIIPGQRARFAWWLQKFLPRRLTNAIADRMVARVRAART